MMARSLDVLEGKIGHVRDDDLTAVLLPIANPEAIAELLTHLLRDPIRLSHAASLSYTHVNGFTKIVLLAPSGTRVKLRLHLWTGRNGGTDEHIHNHAWAFSSVLITGSYRFQLFEKTVENGQEYFHYISSSPDRGGEGYKLRSLGTAKLSCVFDGRLTAGDVYRMTWTPLHRVIGPETGLTSTLCLQGPFAREESDIYSVTAVNGASAEEMQMLKPMQLRSILRDYLAILARG
jgi:hypothetical protein